MYFSCKINYSVVTKQHFIVITLWERCTMYAKSDDQKRLCFVIQSFLYFILRGS